MIQPSDERNLLQETLEVMSQYGKTPDDVQFVIAGTNYSWHMPQDFEWSTWDEFAAVANFLYDSGYGGANVSETLKVVGGDWWLERGEYDGSEWWEFKALPIRPEIHTTDLGVRSR